MELSDLGRAERGSIGGRGGAGCTAEVLAERGVGRTAAVPATRGAARTAAEVLAGRELYVIGDVHLHAGSDPQVAVQLAGLVGRLTAGSPRAGIVFNGDLFDLDRVRGERRAGLGAGSAAARIERVLAAFPDLTAAWKAHRAAGGALVFVAGNHDAELLLPEVQEVLRRRLGGVDAAALLVLETVSLPGVFIQHGHQVDPDSTFHPDTASAVRKGRLSAFPLASLLTRLLLSHIPRFELRDDNHQGPLAVLMRTLRDYKLAALRMIARYPLAGVRIAWQSVLGRLRRDVARHAPGSMSSPWRVIQRLYLDRYFGAVLALALILLLVTGVLGARLWWLPALAGLYLAVPPFRRRRRFFGRDALRLARDARARVAQGVRIVVSGHTHVPFVEPLGEAVHANHGAFSSPVPLDGAGRPCRASARAAQRLRGCAQRVRTYLHITLRPLSCSLLTWPCRPLVADGGPRCEEPEGPDAACVVTAAGAA